jgi:hypothetical protein
MRDLRDIRVPVLLFIGVIFVGIWGTSIAE